MEREIKTTLELDGAEKFKNNLKSVDSELKVLGKQFDVLSSKYNDSAKSMSSLATQQKNLQSQVSLNTSKVKAYSEAVKTQTEAYDKEQKKLDELIEKEGLNSKAVEQQAKVVRKAEIELDTYRKRLADSEQALMKSSAELKRFNDENGKTKIGQSFTAGKAAVENFKQQITDVTSKLSPLADGIKKMSKEAANISFKAAKASAETFAKTTEKAMEAGIKAVASYTKALTKAATAGAALAATSVTAITKAAVDQYGNYEQLVGGVETLFKDSAPKVQKYADDAFKNAGMSANEYMETVTSFSASLLQSLNGDTEKAADKADMAIRDMSDNANKMGTDMASIQNAYQGFAKQNYTMLDNLKLGYGGTKSEMERLLADAEKISGVHYDISSYSDMIDAIHVVQTEIGITGTTQEEAAKTIQGSTAAMKSAYKNLLTGIATDGADIDKLVDDFISSIEAVGDNMIPTIQRALKGVGKVIDSAVPLIVKKVPPLVAKVLPDLTKTTGKLIKQIGEYAGKAMPTFTQKVLPKAVQELQKSLPTLLTNVTTGFNSILTGAADAIIVALPVVTQTILPAMIQGTTDLVTGLIDKLPEAVTELTAGAVTLFMGLIDGLNQVADELLPMLPELVGTVTDALVENLPQFLEGALQLFGKLIEALADVTNEIMPKIPKLIEDISSQLVDEGELDKIIDSGFDLLISLVEGFANAMPTIMAELPKIVVSIADRLTKPSNLGRLIKAGVKLIKAVAEGLPKAIHYLLENIPTIIDNIWNSLMEVDWLELGKDVAKGILDGFLNIGDYIMDVIEEFGDEVKSGVKKFFGIHSPSTVMRDEVGQYLGLGVVEGFTDTMAAKTEEMAKSIPREFDTDVKLNTNADLAYARSISRANGGNNTYNIPVNITFTGNIDSSTNVRKLAEDLAQETQYQLAGMGLTG